MLEGEIFSSLDSSAINNPPKLGTSGVGVGIGVGIGVGVFMTFT